jgi:hypothetical protein
VGALRAVTRREGIHEAADPLREILDAGEDAAHGRQGAVAIERFLDVAAVAPDVPERLAVVGDLSFEVARGVHAQWPEQPLADHFPVLVACDVGDQAAEDA